MIIEFKEEQLELLKEIVRDYTDYTYESIMDYNRCALASEDELVKKEYMELAADEEEKYNAARKMRAYLDKYPITDEY